MGLMDLLKIIVARDRSDSYTARSFLLCLELAANPAYRKLTDTIPLTAQALSLPQLQGSSAVRDFRSSHAERQVLAGLKAEQEAITPLIDG